MRFRNLTISIVVLSGIFLSPWMIRSFVPGLPSILEGRPQHFYILAQFNGEPAPRLLNMQEGAMVGDWVLEMNCVASSEGWKPDGGLVERIELHAKSDQRYILDVYKDDLGGQADSFEYLCLKGQYLPLSSSENVFGFSLPAYGTLSWAAVSILWILLGFLLWWIWGRKQQPVA